MDFKALRSRFETKKSLEPHTSGGTPSAPPTPTKIDLPWRENWKPNDSVIARDNKQQKPSAVIAVRSAVLPSTPSPSSSMNLSRSHSTPVPASPSTNTSPHSTQRFTTPIIFSGSGSASTSPNTTQTFTLPLLHPPSPVLVSTTPPPVAMHATLLPLKSVSPAMPASPVFSSSAAMSTLLSIPAISSSEDSRKASVSPVHDQNQEIAHLLVAQTCGTSDPNQELLSVATEIRQLQQRRAAVRQQTEHAKALLERQLNQQDDAFDREFSGVLDRLSTVHTARQNKALTELSEQTRTLMSCFRRVASCLGVEMPELLGVDQIQAYSAQIEAELHARESRSALLSASVECLKRDTETMRIHSKSEESSKLREFEKAQELKREVTTLREEVTSLKQDVATGSDNQSKLQTALSDCQNQLVVLTAKLQLAEENARQTVIRETVLANKLRTSEETVQAKGLEINNIRRQYELMQGKGLQDLNNVDLVKLDLSLKAAQNQVMMRILSCGEELERQRNEEKLCIICADQKKDCFFHPCGHICCCLACSKRIQACPLCRQKIEKFSHAYT